MDHQEEELLEAVWTAEERQDPSRPTIAALAHTPVDETLYTGLIAKGLIEVGPERVALTAEGRVAASALIRRHRLAERLLHDVLKLRVEDTEANACEFEHNLAPQVTESICTLLGHPRECPHGSPIPEGQCCLEARRQVQSLVIPLTETQPGETARVAYIQTAHHPRLHKLISFGIAPGTRLHVHQKYPSIIIQAGNTELALEEDIAGDIFVWRE